MEKYIFKRVNKLPGWIRVLIPYFVLFVFYLFARYLYRSWYSNEGVYFMFMIMFCILGLLISSLSMLVFIRGITVQVAFDTKLKTLELVKQRMNIFYSKKLFDFRDVKYKLIYDEKIIFYIRDSDIENYYILKSEFPDDFKQISNLLTAYLTNLQESC
jgi:hypothetical protein